MKILGVAIKQNDLIICQPAPARHHDCIEYAIEVLGLKPPMSSLFLNQGFYLENGQYLDRNEALVVAKEENQIIHNVGLEFLTSEDLW
jgi:hypothetical protein